MMNLSIILFVIILKILNWLSRSNHGFIKIFIHRLTVFLAIFIIPMFQLPALSFAQFASKLLRDRIRTLSKSIRFILKCVGINFDIGLIHTAHRAFSIQNICWRMRLYNAFLRLCNLSLTLHLINLILFILILFNCRCFIYFTYLDIVRIFSRLEFVANAKYVAKFFEYRPWKHIWWVVSCHRMILLSIFPEFTSSILNRFLLIS